MACVSFLSNIWPWSFTGLWPRLPGRLDSLITVFYRGFHPHPPRPAPNPSRTHADGHRDMWAHTHVCMHAHTNTQPHIQTRIHKHTHTRAHTHTRTHTYAHPPLNYANLLFKVKTYHLHQGRYNWPENFLSSVQKCWFDSGDELGSHQNGCASLSLPQMMSHQQF